MLHGSLLVQVGTHSFDRSLGLVLLRGALFRLKGQRNTILGLQIFHVPSKSLAFPFGHGAKAKSYPQGTSDSIHTKIGSKLGGEFTYQPKWDPITVLTTAIWVWPGVPLEPRLRGGDPLELPHGLGALGGAAALLRMGCSNSSR